MSDKHTVMKYDPTINLGNVIQAVLLTFAIIGGYTAMQVQINTNAKDIESLKEADQRVSTEVKELRKEIKELSKDINDLNINLVRALQYMEGRRND